MYSRIRNLREDKDMTQKDIGNILNMSQTWYNQYEIGKNDIPTKILIKLANFYNTSVDYLLELTDEKKPYPRKKTGKKWFTSFFIYLLIKVSLQQAF